MRNLHFHNPYVHLRLYRKLDKHIQHVGLYLWKNRNGTIELRCCARTHGGKTHRLLSLSKA